MWGLWPCAHRPGEPATPAHSAGSRSACPTQGSTPSRLPLAGAPRAAGAGAGNCRHASACLGSRGAFGSRAPGGNRMNWKWPAEFRDFALKGNVVDLAIGVIIGAAFGKIVSALVENILMPPIGFLLKGVDFRDLTINIGTAQTPVLIKYGIFLQTVIDFVIIA